MRTILFVIITTSILLSFSSCSSNTYYNINKSFSPDSLSHSLIFYIHGDSDYLYYNDKNEAVYADKKSVEKAMNVAKQLTNSEVFIFYQKRKEYFLFFFPEDDKELYYFRKGKLIARYSTEASETSLLDDEIQFVDKYSVSNKAPNLPTIFLYFGHQIPEKNETGYFVSHPQIAFGIDTLSNKLDQLRSELGIKNFDISILSTCVGGTPYVAEKFSSLTKYLIASPEDLHLSYMDIDYLKELNSMSDIDIEKFSKSFSLNSFNMLKEKTTTIISIVDYNMGKLRKTLSHIKNLTCKESLNLLRDHDGVTIYYRPPKFGKHKNELHHTGWNCAEKE